MTGVSGGNVMVQDCQDCTTVCPCVRFVCVCMRVCELSTSAVVADKGSTLRYHRCVYKHNVL